VRGVAVRHDGQFDAGISFRDLAEEPQELLVPVPGIAGVGDLPGGHLQGGEQRSGAVPDVVMGLLLGDPGPQRQHRRCPFQGLDLGLLINVQHDGLVGRVEVEPGDVAELRLERGTGGELEGLPAATAAARTPAARPRP
jgi:hypothetical protein